MIPNVVRRESFVDSTRDVRRRRVRVLQPRRDHNFVEGQTLPRLGNPYRPQNEQTRTPPCFISYPFSKQTPRHACFRRVIERTMLKLLRIEVSNRKHKKYKAILRNTTTNRLKTVHFGDSRYQHYKDQTKLKKFSRLNHMDTDRRRKFRLRFQKSARKKYSAAYFAMKYLW